MRSERRKKSGHFSVLGQFGHAAVYWQPFLNSTSQIVGGKQP
ncbi:MAG: hypothetical protein ACJASB_000813 [Shewanella psychromarinicola]|jgi:hypothetical protein